MKKFYIILFFLPLFCWSQKQFEVFFDFNKDNPNEVSMRYLNTWINENKNVEITKILGFCDSIDSKEFNKKLAERRINSTLKILQNNSIQLNPKIETIAFGKDFKQSKIQAENRKVTIYYIEFEKPKLASELTEKIKNSKVGESIKLPKIYFYNNSARIVPKSESTLYELLCAMEENPKLKIEIQGHICCQLVFDKNGISTARAKAIYAYLIRNKIDRKRMLFKGYGTSRPIHVIPEKNAQEEDENRRVEVLILEN